MAKAKPAGIGANPLRPFGFSRGGRPVRRRPCAMHHIALRPSPAGATAARKQNCFNLVEKGSGINAGIRWFSPFEGLI
jgi:hypothetical protein